MKSLYRSRRLMPKKPSKAQIDWETKALLAKFRGVTLPPRPLDINPTIGTPNVLLEG